MSIEIKKLYKHYGDQVVFSDLNLTLKENKISVIMGKSGDGKTTLLNCIAGLTDYDGTVEGVSGVSYVFQEDRLIPFMSVYENLDFTLDGSIKGSARRKKIMEMLSLTGLTDKANALIGEISGGQSKRVSIARAFLSDKSVVLMDEPLNSLDLGLKIKITSLLVSLKEKYNKTVVYVTHNIDEALNIADEVFVIEKNGVAYNYSFLSGTKNREILGSECIGVKSKLITLLSGNSSYIE